MDWNYVYYLLYGFVAGLAEFLPVSASAHGYLLEQMSDFNAMHPLLLLCIHGGCFLSVAMGYRARVGHISRDKLYHDLFQKLANVGKK